MEESHPGGEHQGQLAVRPSVHLPVTADDGERGPDCVACLLGFSRRRQLLVGGLGVVVTSKKTNKNPLLHHSNGRKKFQTALNLNSKIKNCEWKHLHCKTSQVLLKRFNASKRWFFQTYQCRVAKVSWKHFFLHLQFACHDLRGHMISSHQMKIQR